MSFPSGLPRPVLPGERVIEIYRASTGTRLSRPLVASRVPAGFPSPAENYIEGRLDLNKKLLKHPVATFYIRVTGDSMVGVGIYEGDFLVVDRAEEPASGHIIIARLGDDLCIKRLMIEAGCVWLVSENPKYKPILVTEETDFEVWGRVLYSIRPH